MGKAARQRQPPSCGYFRFFSSFVVAEPSFMAFSSVLAFGLLAMVRGDGKWSMEWRGVENGNSHAARGLDLRPAHHNGRLRLRRQARRLSKQARRSQIFSKPSRKRQRARRRKTQQENSKRAPSSRQRVGRWQQSRFSRSKKDGPTAAVRREQCQKENKTL